MKGMTAGSLLFSMCMFGVAFGETYTVPDDFLTIQAAIDFSAPNDSILVRPGTYTESLLITKTLSLIAPMGAAATIIDGSAPTRPDTLSVVCALGAENLLIDGFTIRNGPGGSTLIAEVPAESGGGVMFLGGSGVIRNCIITQNFCLGHGAAIYLAGSIASVIDCVMSHNTCMMSGGGIGSLLSSPTIQGCRIENNHAHSMGALNLELGSASIENCVIRANRTDEGWAIFMQDSLIRNTLIVENTGDVPTNIGCVQMQGRVESCTIVGNSGVAALAMRGGPLSHTIIAHNNDEGLRCADNKYSSRLLRYLREWQRQ